MKKDSNTVPVVALKVPEPVKFLRRSIVPLDHLDVDYDAGYMYNVNTKLPAAYRQVQRIHRDRYPEPVLEIAGTIQWLMSMVTMPKKLLKRK